MNNSVKKTGDDVILSLENISKSFPGVQALSNMSIELKRGEIHAVCGENGAGKSTLMKIITGVYHADEGDMYLNGEEVKIYKPDEAYSKGIAIIFQETSLFQDLTVLENIFMGHEIVKPLIGNRFKILDYPAMRKKAQQVFERLGMKINLDEHISNLGVATKQMVEIAKALTHESQILILDEPTAALSNKEVDTLFETIARLKGEGVSMLYISHRLDEIFQIADRVTVIRDGLSVQTEQVVNVKRDQLVSWMIGRTLENLYPKEEVEIGDIVLEVKGLTRYGEIEDIDFVLREGEILGISGLAGAGRTEMALALCGLRKPDNGEVRVNGKAIKLDKYREAMEQGIAYVSEDRQKYGLVIPMNVEENICFPLLPKLSKAFGLIDRKKSKSVGTEYIKKLSVKTPSHETRVMNLSGGNQQKVSVSKALATEPQILILDEPTRGVDVGAKSEIHRIISNLAASGKSIIMISSDLPEILGMSDRVLVMKDGRKQGELMRSECTQAKILEMAL
ncbi:MAG: sugar ABC transporter ATP-binding protein [Sphaerochaetaceae bacterium]